MKDNKINGVISWLRHLDVEFISDENMDKFIEMDLDINNLNDQDEIIDILFRPYFIINNDKARIKLENGLKDALILDEEKLNLAVDKINSFFEVKILDIKGFFFEIK